MDRLRRRIGDMDPDPRAATDHRHGHGIIITMTAARAQARKGNLRNRRRVDTSEDRGGLARRGPRTEVKRTGRSFCVSGCADHHAVPDLYSRIPLLMSFLLLLS